VGEPQSRAILSIKDVAVSGSVACASSLASVVVAVSAAAVVGAVVLVASTTEPNQLINSVTFKFARATAYIIMNVYAIKMAAVFMISTSTVVIYTGIVPKWIAVLGYALALLVLVGSYYISWSFVVLPVWVFLISIHILVDNLRSRDSTIIPDTFNR